VSYASDYKRKTFFEERMPKVGHFVKGAVVKSWRGTKGYLFPPTGRIWRFRIWLIERVILWVICPLAGRPIQIIRQDDQRNGLHHAPACGANHYHHCRPITTACTCGAQREEDHR